MGSSIDLSTLFIHIPREDAEFQRSAVADLLGRRNLNFPGAQPVSFTRRHIRELQEVDYFMCEKTDGLRCLLYLTQHIDPGGELVEAQFLIDRRNEYYYVKRDTLHIPRSEGDLQGFHTGTLLDGELVRQKDKRAPHHERITYLIFDCLATDGENIMNRDFSRRLARIDHMIIRPLKLFYKQWPEAVAHQPFQIEMKKMEFSYGVTMMFDHVLPALPHGNDGLIFTCKDTLYEPGTDQHVLKWKPPEENTVDFRLILGDFPKREDEQGVYEDFDGTPEIELWVNHGGERGYQPFGTLHVTDAEWTGFKSLNQPLDGRIIEAYRSAPLSEESGKEIWRPKVEADGTPRFRDDKKDANHISVVQSVLESIQDAVSEQDLKDAAYSIRKAFKERQAEREKREQEERRKVMEAERRKREVEGKRREELRRQEEERMKDGDGHGEMKEASPEPVDEDDGPRYDDDDDDDD